MSKLVTRFTAALVLVIGVGAAHLSADRHDATLAVTMTNDPTSNAIQVYDTHTQAWLQTLTTQGKGGVGGMRGAFSNTVARFWPS